MPADWIFEVVLPAVRAALASVLGVLPPEERHRRGGFFCLRPRQGRAPVIVSLVGTVPDPEKAEKYFLFAQEKASRLALGSGEDRHRSSWESRNPHEDKWGGAIVAGEWIFSFSGLPELADEALVTLVAFSLDLLNPREVAQITAKSRNHFFEPAMERQSTTARRSLTAA